MAILLLLASVTLALAKPANVVYYEPQLPVEAAGLLIHPYAYAHRMPDPVYDHQHTPYAPVDTFSSFVEIRDHVRKGEKQAASLIEVSSDASMGRGREASIKPYADQRYGRAFRRAVYENRRRRMPYIDNAGSLNPFHTANHLFHNTADMMFPRSRDHSVFYDVAHSPRNPADVAQFSPYFFPLGWNLPGNAPTQRGPRGDTNVDVDPNLWRQYPQAFYGFTGGAPPLSPAAPMVPPGPLPRFRSLDQVQSVPLYGGRNFGDNVATGARMPFRQDYPAMPGRVRMGAGGLPEPSPFVGDGQFYDFYNGGGGGGAGSSGSVAEVVGEGAPPPS